MFMRTGFMLGRAVRQDPYWSYVKLLAHFDGADGSTTFTDSSNAAHTVTADGGAQIDTAQSKFGGASLLLDGDGDFLRIPVANFEFGSSDFCVEAWVRSAVIATQGNPIVTKGPSASFDTSMFYFQYGGGGIVNLFFADATASSPILTSSSAVTTDTWTHLAVSRQGTTFRLFFNGALEHSATSSATLAGGSHTNDLHIGTQVFDRGAVNRTLNGWMDDLRITVGHARYTAAFTPHTVAHPNGP